MAEPQAPERLRAARLADARSWHQNLLLGVDGAWGPTTVCYFVSVLFAEVDALTEDRDRLRDVVAALEAENARRDAWLQSIQHALADGCPAWALEWDRVLEGKEFVESFSTQEVRDEARAVIDPIAKVVSEWYDEQPHAPAPAPAPACPHGDVTCPCPDGDLCHYEGPDAWPSPGAALVDESFDREEA